MSPRDVPQKPRIFRADGRWVVATWAHRMPATGAMIYLPAGEGKTPADAWKDYRYTTEPSLLQRIKRALS